MKVPFITSRASRRQGVEGVVGWRTRAGWTVVWLLALVVTLGVGWAVPREPLLALGVTAVVAVIGVTVRQPALLPVLAMPCIIVSARLGTGEMSVSFSDVVLGLAFWPAALFAPRPFSRQLRQMLWLSAIYQASTLFTVVANPYPANVIEWFHAWLLVGGALVVGWAVGRSSLAPQGLTLFLISCACLALVTVIQGIAQWIGGDFAAVYTAWPWVMHKNLVGCVLGFSALLAFSRPSWMGWSRWAALGVFWMSIVGLGFTQSRQALAGLAVGLAVVMFRRHPDRRRSVLVLVALVPLLVAGATLVRDQVTSGNVHNSLFQRLTWFEETMEAWTQSPLLGNGLRYWNRQDLSYDFQPPNALLEVLASAGVVGLVGFLVMATGILVVLWRMNPTYGTTAFALVLSRLVQGQLDLFWVGVQTSIPFLVAGVCLGAASLAAGQGAVARRPIVGQRVSA